MFTGSGVTVMTGLIANVEGALSAGAGMGFQSAIGSGVVIRTGIIQNIHVSASFGCGVGHSQFIGSGTVVYTNILLARTTMLPVFYGTLGLRMARRGLLSLDRKGGDGTRTQATPTSMFVSGVGGYLFCGSGTMTITNTVAALVNGIGITTGKSTARRNRTRFSVLDKSNHTYTQLPIQAPASGRCSWPAGSSGPTT